MPKRGSSQVTILDLAHRLNLSRGAVSQALNGNPSTIRLSKETVKRVRDMAEKMGYRPNRAAQILRTGRSGLVGILLRQGFSPLTPIHLFHARLHAERVGLVPFVYEIMSSKPDAESVALRFILDHKVDALVVMGWQEDLRLLYNTGIPIALIAPRSQPLVPTYYVDQVNGYRMVAEHLIEEGHREIALVVEHKKTNYHISAQTGVEKAVRAARRKGIKVSWFSHLAQPGEYEGYMLKGVPHMHGLYASGYIAMKELIETRKLPDAVMFQNDPWAQGALRACKEHGLRVPEDVAISGFGDEPSSGAGILSLTSVSQPMEELQRSIFDDIRSALDGKEVSPDRYVEFPGKLVIRESSLGKAH